MVLRKLLGFAALCLATCMALVDRAFATAANLFSSAISPLSFNSPALAFEGWGGDANDPALLNSLRHEAGLHRRSADRNI